MIIPLGKIENLKVGVLNDVSSIYLVNILTTDQKLHTLVPTNPFEPTLAFDTNRNECYAMYSILDLLKKGEVPNYDPNPYMRQLAQQAVPTYMRGVQEEWDNDITSLCRGANRSAKGSLPALCNPLSGQAHVVVYLTILPGG